MAPSPPSGPHDPDPFIPPSPIRLIERLMQWPIWWQQFFKPFDLLPRVHCPALAATYVCTYSFRQCHFKARALVARRNALHSHALLLQERVLVMVGSKSDKPEEGS